MSMYRTKELGNCKITIEVDGKIYRTINAEHVDICLERDVIFDKNEEGAYTLGGEYFVIHGWSKDDKKGYRGKLVERSDGEMIVPV